jgi:aryl sulfotransferase
MQMICALLVFQTSELPRPLAELSPWVDWLVTPREEVYERLAAQAHRRFVKTHTPLDGIPLDSRATYIVVARHPLDMAVSLYHQGDNLDRERIAELTGQAQSSVPQSERPLLHGGEMLSSDELAHYHARTEGMAPPDLLAWLHRKENADGH